MKNKIVLMLATFAILSIVFLPRSHDTKSQRKARLIPIPLEKASNQSIADTDNGPKTKLLERVQDKSSLPFQVTHFSRHFTDKKSSESVVVMTAGGASRFSIASDFAFPHALNTLRGAEEIARTRWVQELASIMMTWPDNRTVMVVSGNTEFQQPLLNWIISAVLKANVSLDRILILAADESLYEVLKERRVESVFVPPTSLYDTKIHQLGIHKLITFARFAVVRLLNYWGFTVAHYDSDALILRDTQRIYENYPLSSIVASKGAGPRSLCAGSVLFRSGRQIGKFIAICKVQKLIHDRVSC